MIFFLEISGTEMTSALILRPKMKVIKFYSKSIPDEVNIHIYQVLAIETGLKALNIIKIKFENSPNFSGVSAFRNFFGYDFFLEISGTEMTSALILGPKMKVIKFYSKSIPDEVNIHIYQVLAIETGL